MRLECSSNTSFTRCKARPGLRTSARPVSRSNGEPPELAIILLQCPFCVQPCKLYTASQSLASLSPPKMPLGIHCKYCGPGTGYPLVPAEAARDFMPPDWMFRPLLSGPGCRYADLSQLWHAREMAVPGRRVQPSRGIEWIANYADGRSYRRRRKPSGYDRGPAGAGGIPRGIGLRRPHGL